MTLGQWFELISPAAFGIAGLVIFLSARADQRKRNAEIEKSWGVRRERD